MKGRTLFFLLFIMLSCLAKAQRVTTLTEWEFSKDSTHWEIVEVPHSTNGIDGRSKKYYRGKTFYRRYLYMTKVDARRPTYLFFEGAAQQCDIYLNGEKLAHHYGGYTGFSVNITGKLRVGENTVLVMCNNHGDRNLIPVSSDFNKNNGLHNPVRMYQLGEVYFDPSSNGPYRLKAYSIHNDNGNERLIIKHDVRSTKKKAKVDFVYTIKDREGTIVMMNARTMEVRDGHTISVTNEMTLSDVHLWDGLNDPYLYTIEVDIRENGVMQDHTSTKFGFRYFQMTPDHGFMLNGRPYPLRGVAMHQDTDGKASALTKDDYDRDYQIVKEIGANFLRLAHYPHNDYAFQLCDSLGIIVQTEIPWVNVCGEKASQMYFQVIRQQAEEMVSNQFNHPSICMWGMWNELDFWGNNDKLQGPLDCEAVVRETANVYTLIRTLDPIRSIGMTDCSVYRNEGYKDLMANFYSENRYHGWYYSQGSVEGFQNFTKDMNEIHDKVHTHVANVAEYGAGINPFCHTVDTTKLFQRDDDSKHYEEYGNLIHENHWQQICQMPWLNFTSAWVMFDFPVANREEGYQDSDNGVTFTANEKRKYMNDKGLVTRDRQTKKDVFYLYKSAWNKDATTVHITSTRMKQWPKGEPLKVKVYSNAASLTLYLNGEKKQTLTSSGEISGVIWQFDPIYPYAPQNIIRVVADDGTEDKWELIPHNAEAR